MAVRRDAGLAVVRLAPRSTRCFPRWRQRARSGRSAASMSSPARQRHSRSAEMVLQLRDPDNAVLDRLEAAVTKLVNDAERQRAVQGVDRADAAHRSPRLWRRNYGRHPRRGRGARSRAGTRDMPSGAGHDAMVFSRHMPSAMLFVPSIDGISPPLDREHERRGHRHGRARVCRRGGEAAEGGAVTFPRSATPSATAAAGLPLGRILTSRPSAATPLPLLPVLTGRRSG